MVPELSVLAWGPTTEFLELLVKMAQIVESAIIADVFHTHVGVEKQLPGKVYFDLVQVFEDRKSGGTFKESADRCRCHMSHPGDLLERDLLPVIFHQVT